MITPSRVFSSLALTMLLGAPVLRAQWTAPTPEELSMTSIPEVPGAPALYLFKEQTADDGQHMQSFYFRIKVLTEGGKKYADVELPYFFGSSGVSLDTITGRTIHPDGTIVPFTGKPYEKTVEKGLFQGEQYQLKVKVFSLPSVEIGSIIEYRYKLHLDEHNFRVPDWDVQTDLFTRKAHYMWRPTDQQLSTSDGKQVSTGVAWTPLLPPGVVVKQTPVPVSTTVDGGHVQLDLEVQNIPPVLKEEFMPPMESLSYKVLFYYTQYRTEKEFWNAEGKNWSKDLNKFIGPGKVVTAQVQTLTAPGDTSEQKLRKFYAYLMSFDNTDFTREHMSSEERAQGLKDIKTADDVVTRKRGSGDQIAEVFVAMARAAGMKAYVMGVANREHRFFLGPYLSMRQLEDLIAIVNVDGKEEFFDPGERYCTFGQLSWRHALTGGLRQTDTGTDLANTPGTGYKEQHVSRIADLKLDDQGVATGTVTLTYTGDAALAWRQDALRGDETSLSTELRTHMEETLPGGMEIKVAKIDNLTTAEQPLKVTYDVKGAIGSPTGKRLLVPANLFEVNSKPTFPQAKRDLAVDMRHPSQTQDAVRYTLPASMVVESAPTAGKESMPNAAVFDTSIKNAGNSVTVYRNFTMGRTMFFTSDYPELRGFYGKVEARDQETLVLTRADASAAKPAGGGN